MTEQAFSCETCGKFFKRKDHLKRHMANHSGQTLSCPRCESTFTRSDLLVRHLRRHERKDHEAGGEGLGELSTRRKVWDPVIGYVTKNKSSRSSPESLTPCQTEKPKKTKKKVEFWDEQQHREVEADDGSSVETQNSSALSDHCSSLTSIEPLCLEPQKVLLSEQENVNNEARACVQQDFWINNKQDQTSHKKSKVFFDIDSLADLKMSLPQIDSNTHFNFTKFLGSISGPELQSSLQSSGFLEQQRLQEFLDLFFVEFNIPYPLIHVASFDPAQVHIVLLTSILVFGASYSSKELHKVAVRLNDVLTTIVFNPNCLSEKLWVLQSMLLVQTFGMYRAGPKQQEMSKLFNGVLIQLLKKSDCLGTTTYLNFQQGNLGEQWQDWVVFESKKRVALFTFIWDTQQAMFFKQAASVPVYECKMHSPCSSTLWAANNPQRWNDVKQSEIPSEFFLTTLKGFLNHSNNDVQGINSLTRFMVLHGLLSISCDMSHQDTASLNSLWGVSDWKPRICGAFELWKKEMDMFQNTAKLSLTNSGHLESLARYISSNTAIYHCAHMLLWTDATSFNVHSGAQHVFGKNSVSESEGFAKKIITQWSSNGARSENAVWHASQLITEGFVNLENWEADGSFHYEWCLYLATLILWCFFKLPDDQSDKQTFTRVIERSGKHRRLIAVSRTDADTFALAKMMLVISKESLSTVKFLTIDPSPLLKEMIMLFQDSKLENVREAQLILERMLQVV